MNDFDILQQSLAPSTSIDLDSIIGWIVIPSIIITVLITIAFVVYMTRRWRVEKAILEIRDTLKQIQTSLDKPTRQNDQPIMDSPSNNSNDTHYVANQ